LRRTLAALLDGAGFDVVAVIHERTPVKYTLARGGFRRLLRSPRLLLFALVFLPALLAGPMVGAGDEIVVLARAR
jgi:hypothetical protein